MSGRSMVTQAPEAAGPEHPTGVVELRRDAALTATCAGPHRLGPEVDDVGEDQHRDGLVEGADPVDLERPEHERQGDDDTGQGEARW